MVSDRVPTPDPRSPRGRALAWRGLLLGTLAQAVVTIEIAGPAFLIPYLRRHESFTLATAGTAAAATSLGMVLTLVAWGALADRRGERLALTAGLLACAAATGLGVILAQAGLLHAPLPLIGILALAGAAGASVNTATGRVVAGWFPRNQRGKAMGARQMAQPLGTALAAVIVPPLAEEWELTGFFALVAALCLLTGLACLWGVVDPPRAGRTELEQPHNSESPVREGVPNRDRGSASDDVTAVAGGAHGFREVNPYRADSFLWRVHLLSALLVVPQFAFATFGLVWLIDSQNMAAQTAGLVVGAAQLAGAGARFVMGALSDRAPSRMVVLRWVALSAALLTGAVALASLGTVPIIAIVVFIFASAASVADNSLAFTSIAEAAGSRWSGKAMGIQNTGQHVVASAVGPGLGALITASGYPVALLCVAIVPLAALLLVPTRDVERP